MSVLQAFGLLLRLATAQPFLNNDTITGALNVLVNVFPQCTDGEILQLLPRNLPGAMPHTERVQRLLQRVRLTNHFGSLSPLQEPSRGAVVLHSQADYNERLDAAQTFLNRHTSDDTFLQRIVAIDEAPFRNGGDRTVQHMIGAYVRDRIIFYALPEPDVALNAVYFTHFLRRLVPILADMGFNMHNRPILMLDNVNFHRTREVQEYIDHLNCEVIWTPRQSGDDFMPWDIDAFDLIRRIATPQHQRDNQELRRALEEAVNTINTEDLLSAIDELPQRWQFVADNHGRRVQFTPPRRHRDKRDKVTGTMLQSH